MHPLVSILQVWVCLILCHRIAANDEFKYPILSADKFAIFNDTDERPFAIRRVPMPSTVVSSCYEVLGSHEDKFNFCYPSINIIGVGKCGTSSLYDFLTSHERMREANHEKEYCRVGTYVQFFKGLSKIRGLYGQVFVNGCIDTRESRRLHRMLQPTSAYILSVRNLADRMWAAYNFWCNDAIDRDCGSPNWTKAGMYRTPEMFHEFLLSHEKPQKKPITTSCIGQAAYFKNMISIFTGNDLPHPHVIAIEGLSHDGAVDHVTRLQHYINSVLKVNITLDIHNLHRVNTGDHKGSGVVKITKKYEEGQYAISGHRHMLDESRELMNRCWKECREISELTHYAYNCTTS